ncbi:type II toxin-antitoxin system RelE/ParE family toxin [Duganella violaceipulchra]|uniref:Plasmid stabilization system protein ParE n=1 Tax=Duganella violaceipulchra TaxID=2849652 RepID=A0AA41HGW4_9BURK|nr:type II toxin-antitoxin system RelE/ParE family toxin [Duganella violaceicalia]MBV6323543.1 type II toxin-antitoxin system RelE/ParE family toxin [Duganella violaceicalia]MCP2008897.1 plasmid stabilization system protein ParE [Duganella violaceicalia]
MTRVELAAEVAEDFDRIIEHLAQSASSDAPGRINEIVQAIEVLAHNPLIGRPTAGGKRELVIGRKGRGYVALYCFVEKIDTVYVLGIRSQREAGYAR